MKNRYRSGFEARLAKELHEAGLQLDTTPGPGAFSYESYTYWYCKRIAGQCLQCESEEVVSWHTYTPDFFLPSGVIVEAKGKWVSGHRTTILKMREQYPEIDLRMVFMANNWLTKRKKRRYSDYCEQKGIPYAVGSIPKTWYQ